jgi:hypothetical protein
MKYKRRFTDFVVLSNLAFLAPLLLAISKTQYLYAALIFAVFIFSCLFHFNKERKFIAIDAIFAWLLIIINIYFFYLKSFGLTFWIALIFVVVGLYFKTKNHSIWHIASAIITLLALT